MPSLRLPNRPARPGVRRTVVLIFALLLGQIAGLVTGAEPTRAAALRIMPLGDSITHGLEAKHWCCGVPGAYRIDLDARLRAAGFAFDFVGSQSNGPQIDKNHEGRPGYRIDEIHNGRPGVNTGINQWLPARVPDVVLLMIGTNDILQNRDVPNAPTRLSALVDRIMELRPTAQVYVSSIPPLVGPKAGLNSKVVSYNSSVEQIIANKAAAGKPVRFVDAYPAFTASDLGADGIHPTRAGHDKVARVWGDALLGAAPPPTDTTAPLVTGRSPVPNATGVSTTTAVTATFNEPLAQGTVTGATFTLASGAVAATVSYDGPSRTATLTPSAALAPGVSYTATLKGGSGGISDLAGNRLAQDVVWTFTTASSPPPPPPGDGWVHAGTGALASSTVATAGVPYPAGVANGDLLVLGCQGRNNSMDWFADGFQAMQAPTGPSGLRLELLYRWAAGTESGNVSVSNAVPTNGWSCSITALRGGPGSGDPLAIAPTTQIGSNRVMTAPGLASVPSGTLVTRWYASSDDNNHGGQSEGTLGFGGLAYQTLTGVHHASSMSYALTTATGTRGAATMLQNANSADPFIGVSVALRPSAP